jgi:hypothetical protein
MRVYIAAPWIAKDQARDAAAAFEAEGHEITKKWWEHREVPGYLTTDADNRELEQQAEEDIQGVITADAFVLLNLSKSEGKAVETGFALGHCRKHILVGEKSNLFHYLSDWKQVGTVGEAVEALR